jgi:hypothetical protein
VLPAVVPTVLWTWYVGVYPEPLHARSVGLAPAVYTIATIGGCLAAGRVRWLSTAEPFGICSDGWPGFPVAA